MLLINLSFAIIFIINFFLCSNLLILRNVHFCIVFIFSPFFLFSKFGLIFAYLRIFFARASVILFEHPSFCNVCNFYHELYAYKRNVIEEMYSVFFECKCRCTFFLLIYLIIGKPGIKQLI